MRTTVDLPSTVHRQVVKIARTTGRPLPDVIADLIIRGLGGLEIPVVIATDERSGFPVVSVGCRVTSAQVTGALYDE